MAFEQGGDVLFLTCLLLPGMDFEQSRCQGFRMVEQFLCPEICLKFTGS